MILFTPSRGEKYSAYTLNSRAAYCSALSCPLVVDDVAWPDGGDDGDDTFNSGELIGNSFWIFTLFNLTKLWFYSAYLPIFRHASWADYHAQRV